MDFRQDPAYEDIVAHLEATRGLPKGLLHSIVSNESGGNPNAVSPVGAQGLVQFMPAAAQQYAVNMADPADQLRGGADFLQDLIHQYDGNVAAAVSHYNGGAHNAQRYVDGAEPSPALVSPAHAAVNKAYVDKVLVGQVNAMVTGLAKHGLSSGEIVSELLKSPTTASLVQEGRASGDSFEQIVKNLGGKPYAPFAKAAERIDQQSALANLVEGGGEGLHSLGAGAHQLWSRATGGDLHALQQQELEHQQDPNVLALGRSTAADIGKGAVQFAPTTAAAMMTGGASLPVSIAAQAAAGGLSGALIPTTGDGQIGRNILTGAAIGGGSEAALGLAGSLAKRVARPSAEAVAEAEKRLALAQQYELPVTPAALNDTARSVLAAAPESAAARGEATAAREALSKQLLRGVGQEGSEITPEAIAAARSEIYKPFDKAIEGKSVQIASHELNPVLDQIVAEYKSSGLGTLQTPMVKNIAQDLKSMVSKTDGEISASTLRNTVKSIREAASADSASWETRSALNRMASTLDDFLSQQHPEVATQLSAANQKWANLQVLEKVMEKTNGQGQFTPNQLAQSVKAAARERFQAGEAPYQDLVSAALKLYGNGQKSGTTTARVAKAASSLNSHDLALGSMIGHPVAALGTVLGGNAIGSGIQGLAASQDPAVIHMLTGVGPQAELRKRALLQALKGAAIQSAQANQTN